MSTAVGLYLLLLAGWSLAAGGTTRMLARRRADASIDWAGAQQVTVEESTLATAAIAG